MSLTVGTGPLAPRAAGAFNLEVPRREGLLYLEPSPRRIRAEFAGQTVVDARHGSLPRDPYHRVDVLETSRHVKVSVGGELLAETRRARVLFETALPPRWYIPAEDVRDSLLVSSEKRTGCAYKGFASYWSVQAGGAVEEDVAWTYREPRREVERIAGYLAFFNERTDIEIDGELQERPLTPWSPRARDPAGESRPR